MEAWWRSIPTWVLITVAAITVAPVVSLVAIALSGWGMWGHIAGTVLPATLLTTLGLLVGVACVAGLSGTVSAWLITAYRFPGRNVLAWLLPLPLAFPTYIVAYVYGDLLDAAGPIQSTIRQMFGYRMRAEYVFPEIRSLGGAIMVMGFVLYPYIYLTARSMFMTQSANLIEAARTLGARPGSIARHVALPLARPALAVGLALVLLETLNDIGASEYLGIRTLSVSIFTTWQAQNNLAGAAQISVVMLLAVAALLALEALGRADKRFTAPTKWPRPVQPTSLAGGRAAFATLACAIPVVMGFVIPAGYLGWLASRRGLGSSGLAELMSSVVATVSLAAVATVLTLGIGLGAVVASRKVRKRIATVGLSLASIGYALPGTVLALALLTPLVGLDGLIDTLAQAIGLPPQGLLLAGTSAALVIAYCIRFLGIATGSIHAGFSRMSPHLDEAARTLGASPGELLRRVQLPLIKPALAGAALLVFVDCLKELPATLLLRPLNLETLATSVYSEASRGSFETSALAALLIVLAGLGPVIRLTWHAERGPANDPAEEAGSLRASSPRGS